MFRFMLFVFLLVFKQSASQQTPFTKFTLSDVPINSLSEQIFNTNNTNIKYVILVKLTSCQIVEIDNASFRQMKYLRFVSLAYNQIKIIPTDLFFNNRIIKSINFANNEISMLQNGIFANLKLVESITLSHNKIVRVEANVFKDLTMLRSLDLSNNYLKNMWPDMFVNNMDLQKLLLDGNKIDVINNQLFSTLDKLLFLDLNRNQLSDINTKVFESLQSLVILNLEHNYIKHIEIGSFDNNIKLRALNLNENLLEKLDNGLFTKLMKLEHLNLNGNEINIVDDYVFPASPVLSTISLLRNKLMFMSPKPFEKLTGLRNLSIADNFWYCDCKLMEFHSFYIFNDNIKKDTIICYQPKNVADRAWTEINSNEFICDEDEFEIPPLVLYPNNSESNEIIDSFPPYIMNSTFPPENNYEKENMTMNDMKREIMKISLGGTQYEDTPPNYAPNEMVTKLPDCFNNDATYFDEKYNKNFVEWRARFLGEFLIMYTSAKHSSFNSNSYVYKQSASAMLVPNQNGFTFMDPSLSQMDWKYINDYLQEFCSMTDQVLNGHSKNVIKNYAALEEVSKFIDTLGDVVKARLRTSANNMGKGNVKLPERKQPVREVMAMNDDDAITNMMPVFSKLSVVNVTEGKNIYYYIINAKAEGQGHVNIIHMDKDYKSNPYEN